MTLPEVATDQKIDTSKMKVSDEVAVDSIDITFP